ncbi:MAG: FHA domain-containing protein [Defluviitaleaceae bacterium]|nr:FHA domain-containing protein [Defluviitaleaceae bacterium]
MFKSEEGRDGNTYLTLNKSNQADDIAFKTIVTEERRSGKTYVTVNVSNQADEAAFKTITRSKPRFIPMMTAIETGGEQRFVYDVMAGGFQRVDRLARGMSPTDFLVFMKNLTGAIVSCEDYFLDPLNFLIAESFVYVDPDTQDARLIYLPFTNTVFTEDEVNKHMHSLTLSLLRRFSAGPTSRSWKELIALMRGLTEETTVYEANVMYTNLYNKVTAAKARVESAKRQEQPAQAAEPAPPLTPTPAPTPTDPTPTGSKIAKPPTKAAHRPQAPKPQPATEPPKPEAPKRGLFGFLFGSKNAEKSIESKFVPPDDDMTLPDFDDDMTIADFDDEEQDLPAVLHLLDGGQSTLKIILDKSPFALGRNREQVDYAFESEEDRRIGRVHATIIREGSHYYIIDQQSRNGTFIDGEKLEPDKPTPLEDGALIRIGRRELRFEL